MISANTHPFSVIEKLKQGDDLDNYTYHVTIYNRSSLKTNPDRDIIQVESQDLTFNWFGDLYDRLLPTEEISLSSRVLFDASVELHIPMIDFEGPMEAYKLEMLRKVLPAKYADKLILFDSGKSLHGYVTELVTKEEWIYFMGELLLLNLRGKPVSDTRWIGHRLKEGFSCLRWSCNTDKHKKAPTLLGNLETLEASYGLC